jgi:eukaryotic-like serine/threonine-protein kinase
MIGKTLGHYQISAQLGKGGMGEVYQAKDQVLGRDVAIKVLPEEFARDADRVARFQREAKLLASLNHPNIATIHGLEEAGGTRFLVMELVEGETLADQIKRGPIPVEESLKLALQIAEALEAAHDKGVIHRDLKPANIKITPDGKVKVLDFGLAKAFAGEQEQLNLSNSPTLSNAATQQGVIIGTAAYMAPEQAKGKTVDRRADIWAFGSVLFEMLTGRVAFRGEDVSEILASVIKGDVKLDLLPANLHSRVHEVIIRCLQRDLNKRYQDIRDARYEIEQALADPGGVLVQQPEKAENRMNLARILPWVMAALGIAIAGVVLWIWRTPEPRQVVRFYYELPKNQEFSNFMDRNLAVSPDGKYLVYGTGAGLYRRSIDDLDAKIIPGTEGSPQQPFFSPDGNWIGYWSGTDNKIKKVTMGSTPVTLCNAEGFSGGSWSEDNMIVYSDRVRGLMRVSANGGTPEVLAKADQKPLRFPQILPGGKSVLLASGELVENIAVLSLKSGKIKELFLGDAPQFLRSGHIVYLDGEARLSAIPFDPAKLEVSGGAVPIVEGMVGLGGSTQYAISESGTLAYVPELGNTAEAEQRTLVWVDRNGKEEPISAPPNAYWDPAISPDGTKIALGIGSIGNNNIWVWDLLRKTLTKLTFDSGGADPYWTPDGKRIVFMTPRSGRYGICWKSADGIGKEEFFSSPTDRLIFPSSWGNKGKNLIAEEISGTSNIIMLSAEGDRKRIPLLEEKYNEYHPVISPDGRWMAYTSNESGRDEIYVRPFPEVNAGRWQVSANSGNTPLWSPNGRELFYCTGNTVMAAAVKTDSIFSVEAPKILFSGTHFTAGNFTHWDISRDGKRFLMIKGPTLMTPTGGYGQRINIVLNWFEELKQRVPTK